ncbi:MAG: hypothetical protein H6Q43_3179 [Deltaproteobacteria bacterium]|nr:hypothetical protein [Deltaproteobacteria bacterium]
MLGGGPPAFHLFLRKQEDSADQSEAPGRCFRESRRSPRAQGELYSPKPRIKAMGKGKPYSNFSAFQVFCLISPVIVSQKVHLRCCVATSSLWPVSAPHSSVFARLASGALYEIITHNRKRVIANYVENKSVRVRVSVNNLLNQKRNMF